MSTRIAGIPILFCLLMLGVLGNVFAQNFDISSGGAPTITGALTGSVTGSSSVLNNLLVTINFGEVSPANTNTIVRVVVPIAMRSTVPYQITATYSGSTNANAQAVQNTDIGFGVNNFRPMGSQSQVCTNSTHIIYSPFNNDPSTNVTIGASGRATYPSTINNVGTATLIMSGPRLTRNSNGNRQTNDGYIIDAIFAITPQFFAAGATSATLTFTISNGPNAPC